MKLKSKPIERRMFVSLTGGTMLGVVTIALTGCGQRTEAESESSELAADYVRIYDIQTHVRGSRGFRGSVLKAADVVAGQSVVLTVDEGSHRHSYTVRKEHFDKLVAGETVYIVTERAAGHTHTMEINPQTRARNAGFADVPDGEPDAQLYAALSSSQEPKVALQASEELEADSVEYCLGSQVSCAENAGLWRDMTLTDEFAGKQAFVTPNIRPDDDDTISLRAKTKSGGLAQLVMRFLRR